MATDWQLAGLWGPQDFTDTEGNVISGNLTIYTDAGRTIQATLFTDETKANTAPNPVASDSLGNLSFFAAPGVYYGSFNHGGIVNDTVHLVQPHPSDPALASAVSVEAADATVTVTNPAVGEWSVGANVGTGAGQVAAGNDNRFGTINGIPVTGTPNAGQVPRAGGSSTAAWGSLGAGDITGLGGAATLNVGQSTGQVAAGDDSRFSNIGLIAGTVTVTGTAVAGQVVKASSGTAAAWANLTAGDIAGLGGAATLNVGTTTGSVAAGDDSRFGKIIGSSTVSTSGTPTAGQVLTATSGTGATWQTPPGGVGAVTVSGTPSSGQVLTATSPTTATWSNSSAPSTAPLGTAGGVLSSVDTASVAALLDVTKISPTLVAGSNLLDLSTGRNFWITAPAANSALTFSFTNLPSGRATGITVAFFQDGTTGGSLVTFSGIAKWIGRQPSVDTTPGAVSFFHFICDGGSLYGVGDSEGYSPGDTMFYGSGVDGTLALTSTSGAVANQYTFDGSGIYEQFRDLAYGDGSKISNGATLRLNHWLLQCSGELTLAGIVAVGPVANAVDNHFIGRHAAPAGAVGTSPQSAALRAGVMYLGGIGGGVGGLASPPALPSLPKALSTWIDPMIAVRGFLDSPSLLTFTGPTGVGRGWIGGGTAGNTGKGDGTNAGGTGGQGGGVIVVAARKLTVTSTAGFSAPGSAGGAAAGGNADGGGGGGPGAVIVVCGPESTVNGVALTSASQLAALANNNVAPGAGGAKAGTGTAGSTPAAPANVFYLVQTS